MLIVPRYNGSGVYRFTCIPTGNIYIGGSFELRQRILAHIRLLRNGQHHNPYLQSAWDKYGEAAFLITVEEECSRAQLTEREQYYLDTLQPFAPAHFNITRDASNPARDMSPEARQRRSEAQRQRPPRSAENRQKTSESQHDPITRELNAAAHRGRKHSDETRQKMRDWHAKRPPDSEETRRRRSDSLRRTAEEKRNQRG